MVKIQDAVKKPPPTQEFIEQSASLLLERNPDAAEHLQAARARHLELKEMRREGRIAELLAGGMTDTGAVATTANATATD